MRLGGNNGGKAFATADSLESFSYGTTIQFDSDPRLHATKAYLATSGNVMMRGYARVAPELVVAAARKAPKTTSRGARA